MRKLRYKFDDDKIDYYCVVIDENDKIIHGILEKYISFMSSKDIGKKLLLNGLNLKYIEFGKLDSYSGEVLNNFTGEEIESGYEICFCNTDHEDLTEEELEQEFEYMYSILFNIEYFKNEMVY